MFRINEQSVPGYDVGAESCTCPSSFASAPCSDCFANENSTTAPFPYSLPMLLSKRSAGLLFLSAGLIHTVAAFVHVLLPMRYHGATILLFFQNGATSETFADSIMPSMTTLHSSSSATITGVVVPILLPRAGDAGTASHKTIMSHAKHSVPAKAVEPKLVLPAHQSKRPSSSAVRSVEPVEQQQPMLSSSTGHHSSMVKTKKKQPELIHLSGFASINKKWQSLRDRPGFKFRLRLGIITAAALVVTRAVLKQYGVDTSIVSLTTDWFSQRGFQGVAAMGRTVVYLWGLLVAYPVLLDRRADERHRQQTDKEMERRRDHLVRLAADIARLRHDLATLDAEVRAFRREVILLKVYARSGDNNDHGEIQTAIEAEMAHLAQLRSDTKAALMAARQVWAEYRATSPLEVWDDAVVP